jgi:RES domain-containing protein
MSSLTPEERKHLFPEIFCDVVESWFTADIACCDACYDEFIAKWPHVYLADDAEFQRSAYPLDVIYCGSELAKIYTESEFNEYVKEISCPRCDNALDGNIWPYNFPFEVDADDFETNISEMAALAEATPFLILTHDFARQVYGLLTKLGATLASTTLDASLYRARAGDVREDVAEFDAAPRRFVKEGRYNHAGNPVIYLSSDATTCVAEMRGEPCVIAEVALSTGLKVLDLNNPDTSHPDAANDLAALTYSALMSAKQSDGGWHKPAYVFSRFVADCAKAAGIQAIKYPSTRITRESNFDLVILDPNIRLAQHARIVGFTRFKNDA